MLWQKELGGSIDEPVAPWKYRAIERSLGPSTTARLIREWRRYKLRVAGKLDLLHWKLAGKRLEFSSSGENGLT